MLKASLGCPEGKTGCRTCITEVSLDSKVRPFVLGSGFSNTMSPFSLKIVLNGYNMLCIFLLCIICICMLCIILHYLPLLRCQSQSS